MYSPTSIIQTSIIHTLDYPNFGAKQNLQVIVQNLIWGMQDLCVHDHVQ